MPNYCKTYVNLVYQEQAITQLDHYLSVIFNTIVASLFKFLGERVLVTHTTIEQKTTTFKYIILLEYFNMGVIYILDGLQDYNGFESDWYMSVGVRLSFTLFASTIVTNIQEFYRILKVFYKRFADRGRKLNIKKN